MQHEGTVSMAFTPRHSGIQPAGVRGSEDTQMLRNVRQGDMIFFCLP
jgi:hypothetical protein